MYYSLQVKLEEAEQLDLLGGHNVSTILKSWDSFKGYPVVTVERNYESGHINLTQVSLRFQFPLQSDIANFIDLMFAFKFTSILS